MSARHEIDPVTGYETTGHDWNGIRELNTPFPRIVIWALALTFLWSVGAWILLPAWPTGRDYTRGLLGTDQAAEALAEHARIEALREGWKARFAEGDFEALAADAALMDFARPAAERLFADNCAACHGATGQGGPGFPSLADGDWLWSPEPAGIAEILRVGINSGHEEANIAQMPAFGRDGMLPREEIALLVDHLPRLAGGGAPESPAAALFEENCASCHGEGGAGGLGIGAPALDDAGWTYGGDPAALRATLRNGRAGVMPAWEGRLTPAEINLLALHVAGLAEGAP